MLGIVAPTDSRFRRDLQLHEEGNFEEAERAKKEIEEEQRRKRKKMKNKVWQPNFFKLRDHPYLKNNDMIETHDGKPVFYDIIENEADSKGYWERREKGDWSDMPNLWENFGDQ